MMDDDRTFQQMIEDELEVARNSQNEARREGWLSTVDYWDGQIDAFTWVLEKMAWIEKRDRTGD